MCSKGNSTKQIPIITWAPRNVVPRGNHHGRLQTIWFAWTIIFCADEWNDGCTMKQWFGNISIVWLYKIIEKNDPWRTWLLNDMQGTKLILVKVNYMFVTLIESLRHNSWTDMDDKVERKYNFNVCINIIASINNGISFQSKWDNCPGRVYFFS